tara:strand:- start:965 stop:1795 length:831 start_codon:yes stop_codon:yes gene_type:complete
MSAPPPSSPSPYHSLPIGIQFSSRGLTAPLLQSDAAEETRRRSSPLRSLVPLAALFALALFALPREGMPRLQDSLGLLQIAGDQADGHWGCKYALLDVIFASSRANCGNFVRLKDLERLPSVSFPDADDGQLYAVAVVDVNARGGEYRQLLLGNVPGPALRDGNLSLAGDALTRCAPADVPAATPPAPHVPPVASPTCSHIDPERTSPTRPAAGEPPAPYDDAQPPRLEVLLFCEYGPEVDFAPLPSNRSTWDALTWADGYGFGPPLASNYVWVRS